MKKERTVLQRMDIIILALILIAAFALRLYKYNTPLADLHSWRQVDTAAVARNYARNGVDWLKPRYDDLSDLQTGHENPEGLRYVEFPVYNAIVGYIGSIITSVPIEVIGRIVTALFSLIIIGIIYALTYYEAGRIAAIMAALVYAVFPDFVFFSRVVLPETTAVAFAMLSLLLVYLAVHKKRSTEYIILLMCSAISYALAILVKPTAGFYGLAVAYIVFRAYELNALKKIEYYIYALIALMPFAMWRYFISFHPVGIPPSDWLITSVNTYQGLKVIFLRPAFFRWIFYERINEIILGGYLTFFFILGIVMKPQRYLIHFIFLCGMIYLFVFEGGNVQHEYYQTILLPGLALMVGLGTAHVLQNTKLFLHPLVTWSLVLALYGLSFFFSFYRVQDYYHTPDDLPPIANVIKTITSPSDKIVTDRLGDTTLLYLADRKGAPAIYKDPATLKSLGYSYIVTMNRELINQMKAEGTYKAVFENDKFAMFKL
jgi:4-amino-4-deoxy-L-arabinose transferase-like glycosyltransferase